MLHLRLVMSLGLRLTLNFQSISRDTISSFFPLANTYLCKYHLSLTQSINKRRWTISRISVCSRYRAWLRYSSLLPSRLMYRAKSVARFRREYRKPVLGIQSYLAQPDRRVIFASSNVQYVRRTGNVRVHQVSMRNAESVPPSPLISVTHLHSPLPLRILRREPSHLHKYSRRWKRSRILTRGREWKSKEQPPQRDP